MQSIRFKRQKASDWLLHFKQSTIYTLIYFYFHLISVFRISIKVYNWPRSLIRKGIFRGSVPLFVVLFSISLRAQSSLDISYACVQYTDLINKTRRTKILNFVSNTLTKNMHINFWIMIFFIWNENKNVMKLEIENLPSSLNKNICTNWKI